MTQNERGGNTQLNGRRNFLRFMVVAPVVVFAVGAGAASAQVTAGAAGICPADDDAMRDSLNYLVVSPYGPTKDCSNCRLWSAPVAGASCGGCTLIDGAIDPHGYCDSWALIGTNPEPAKPTGG